MNLFHQTNLVILILPGSMSNPHLEHSGLALLDALFHGKPMSFPLRSASATVGGLYVFGRILDKIRLDSQGLLPAGYHLGIIAGKKTFDDRVCRFLGLDFEALRARTLSGGSDEEILDWCYENGRRPDDEQIEVWNAFMQKRGWNDSATSGLQQQKADAGLSHRDDIQTFFALFDAEEGRA